MRRLTVFAALRTPSTSPPLPDSAFLLPSISTAVVALHKQQFGRGPTRARTEWAGRDALVVFLEDALLPAERELVRVGEAHRVAEQRTYVQRSMMASFVATIERLTGRTVRSYDTAVDAERAAVVELFTFEPR